MSSKRCMLTYFKKAVSRALMIEYVYNDTYSCQNIIRIVRTLNLYDSKPMPIGELLDMGTQPQNSDHTNQLLNRLIILQSNLHINLSTTLLCISTALLCRKNHSMVMKMLMRLSLTLPRGLQL
ncbi:hypothetical protein O6H91_09G095900 [Diphasiastrum complanatum]|uniref:Uncharacterized protein n=1 Tax=Diphasiastrum complanatum TaxID=34168 RepID=A0ACC2CS58_DIPCM|nr:hypothetical protein O6H91_09G095900 [Diphasiastrum complanatum]